MSAARAVDKPLPQQERSGFPVAAGLSPLLPGGCLRPGSSVSTGGDVPLLLALAAEAVGEAGSWAVIGMPHLGVLAAESMGLDAGMGMFVDHPGRRWPEVVAALAEAVPVLLVGVCGPATGRTVQRLRVVLRRTGAVLLTAGAWEGADVRLAVTWARWEGVGVGHGLLRARRVEVAAFGRGAAGGAPRTARLWLPGPEGRAVALPETEPSAGSPADMATGRGPNAALRVVR
ncbi:hypothetical protein G4Z16_00690 [Streptomyces bathyalis]|uniref:Recombinase A n=1 Tax=Streptomyces bathyalis TaxID=2710756 RepID=A0A7T1T2G4_9ACTN|nr:hypothetical protein [Streptomyces bathyalis]QPP05150.1 hypothetical protein G4Z16_00690 [Streptomyces bathyalis]